MVGGKIENKTEKYWKSLMIFGENWKFLLSKWVIVNNAWKFQPEQEVTIEGNMEIISQKNRQVVIIKKSKIIYY